jgi:hypothetical protein
VIELLRQIETRVVVVEVEPGAEIVESEVREDTL